MSALAKRYAPETGTALVNEAFRLVPPARLTCLTMGVLEIISILIRKRNDRRLKQKHFKQAVLDFNAEVVDSKTFAAASADNALIYAAIPLLHAHNINGTDAVVLRSALNLRAAASGRRLDVVDCGSAFGARGDGRRFDGL